MSDAAADTPHPEPASEAAVDTPHTEPMSEAAADISHTEPMSEAAADVSHTDPASEAAADLSLPGEMPVEASLPPGSPDNGPENSGGGFWGNILELLKSEYPVYAALNDSSKAQAELRENVLLIRTDDEFIAGSIINGSFTEPLKDAAFKALGREVAIRVESSSGNERAKRPDSLESLSRFGIVKFEK